MKMEWAITDTGYFIGSNRIKPQDFCRHKDGSRVKIIGFGDMYVWFADQDGQTLKAKFPEFAQEYEFYSGPVRRMLAGWGPFPDREVAATFTD